MIKRWLRPDGPNYPMLMLVVLWAVGTTVFIFREPAVAAVLIAMIPPAAGSI